MTIQHASITDPDIHETKGASSAAAGTVPIANGSGSAPFGYVDYSTLTGKPTLGTAAGSATGDFATAAQGAKADAAVPSTGGTMTGPLKLAAYTLATLPDVTAFNRFLIIVTDASAGPALCISNGTHWIDIRTNTTVV